MMITIFTFILHILMKIYIPCKMNIVRINPEFSVSMNNISFSFCGLCCAFCWNMYHFKSTWYVGPFGTYEGSPLNVF